MGRTPERPCAYSPPGCLRPPVQVDGPVEPPKRHPTGCPVSPLPVKPQGERDFALLDQEHVRIPRSKPGAPAQVRPIAVCIRYPALVCGPPVRMGMRPAGTGAAVADLSAGGLRPRVLSRARRLVDWQAEVSTPHCGLMTCRSPAGEAADRTPTRARPNSPRARDRQQSPSASPSAARIWSAL